MLNIVADIDIPFLKGIFEPYANISYYKGGDIYNFIVKSADVLIVRTRTKCNAALLEGSSVKLIATATIGTDHIDMSYCSANNIAVFNAPGCNSGGVLQYFFTALFAYAADSGIELSYRLKNGIEPDNPTKIGVIGVGNVGSKIADLAEFMGFEVFRNDPPKEREQTLAFNKGYLPIQNFKSYYSLDYLLENSDIVTMHVPLQDDTLKMASDSFFSKMKHGALFMNASRGEVVDEASLLRNFDKFGAVVCDVWNNEPDINEELLNRVFIGTPHIAGYSFEGKVNGTRMTVRSVAKYVCDNVHLKEKVKGDGEADELLIGFENLKSFEVKVAEKNSNIFDFAGKDEKQVSQMLLSVFPLIETSSSLKCGRGDFEKLRNNYNYRREFYVKGF